jgi:hypothetical protein
LLADLADLTTRQCALIDSVLGCDPKSGHTASADPLVARVQEPD